MCRCLHRGSAGAAILSRANVQLLLLKVKFRQNLKERLFRWLSDSVFVGSSSNTVARTHCKERWSHRSALQAMSGSRSPGLTRRLSLRLAAGQAPSHWHCDVVAPERHRLNFRSLIILRALLPQDESLRNTRCAGRGLRRQQGTRKPKRRP